MAQITHKPYTWFEPKLSELNEEIVKSKHTSLIVLGSMGSETHGDRSMRKAELERINKVVLGQHAEPERPGKDSPVKYKLNSLRKKCIEIRKTVGLDQDRASSTSQEEGLFTKHSDHRTWSESFKVYLKIYAQALRDAGRTTDLPSNTPSTQPGSENRIRLELSPSVSDSDSIELISEPPRKKPKGNECAMMSVTDFKEMDKSGKPQYTPIQSADPPVSSLLSNLVMPQEKAVTNNALPEASASKQDQRELVQLLLRMCAEEFSREPIKHNGAKHVYLGPPNTHREQLVQQLRRIALSNSYTIAKTVSDLQQTDMHNRFIIKYDDDLPTGREYWYRGRTLSVLDFLKEVQVLRGAVLGAPSSGI